MKCYDPRLDASPGANANDGSLCVETDNPALIAAELTRYSGDEDISVEAWRRVAAAANYCDQTVGQFTEETARLILEGLVRFGSELFGPDYIGTAACFANWRPGNTQIRIDGSFTAEQLEALAWLMRRKSSNIPER